MRGSTGSSLDERITALELELLSLRREVAALARRLPSVSDEDLRPLVVGPADGRVGESPGLLGQSDALRRVATISFVLVVALLLRTLTDNGIVHPRLGVLLGIAYAWLLVAIGWQRLASGRNGRNVFPICGVALLSALVLESHARFGLLPALPAHALLGAAAVVALMLARRHGAPAVAEAGCLAPAVAAAAMRFPTPEFPMAAGVLLLCGVTAALAAGLRRIAWVHWPVAASSACLWFVWTWKLHAPLARGDAVGPGLWLDWFLPMLTVTFVAQVATGVLVGRRSPTPFWIGSPVWAVAWSFAAAAAVALPEFGAERWLGAAALGVAGLGGGLTRRAGRSQAAALVFAALVAFVPGTWLFAGTW